MYVIVGAGGFLGSYLIKNILENTDEQLIAAARNMNFYGVGNPCVIPCIGDLKDGEYLRRLADTVNRYKNVKIIYTAACHNIDHVAMNPNDAMEMNVNIPQRFIYFLDGFEKLFFTSSDTVYGEGGKSAFSENDELAPISIYGEQKIKGEQIFIENFGTALRLPLMFSESIAPGKKHFCDKICDNLRNNIETMLATGSVRSTLDYGTVADIIIRLSQSEKLPDVLNVSGDDALSKYDLGIMLAKKLGASESLIVPIDTFGNYVEGAARADSTILCNKKIKEILKTEKIKIRL